MCVFWFLFALLYLLCLQTSVYALHFLFLLLGYPLEIKMDYGLVSTGMPHSSGTDGHINLGPPLRQLKVSCLCLQFSLPSHTFVKSKQLQGENVLMELENPHAWLWQVTNIATVEPICGIETNELYLNFRNIDILHMGVYLLLLEWKK